MLVYIAGVKLLRLACTSVTAFSLLHFMLIVHVATHVMMALYIK